MDPYSRRSTWELLRKGKRGRVIILTTHFMDEVRLTFHLLCEPNTTVSTTILQSDSANGWCGTPSL